MLPWMAFLPVPDFADIDRVSEQLVKRSARERQPAGFAPLPGQANLGNDPATVEFVLQQTNGAEYQVAGEDLLHQNGLFRVDDEAAVMNVVAQRRHTSHPEAFAPGGCDL